jgi:uncharacterized protein
LAQESHSARRSGQKALMSIAAPAELEPPQANFDCRACGACCGYSRDWPRFTLESDAEIACIPDRFIARSGSGMRCSGDRCSALIGDIGVVTFCGIYDVRPQVCRACQPGDDACLLARERFRIAAGASGMSPGHVITG